MKKLLLLLSLALAANSLLAQGQVNFNTQLLGTVARVWDASLPGNPFLAGTNYFARLYSGPCADDDSEFAAIGRLVNFRTSVNVGYVQNSGTGPFGQPVDPVVFIPGTTPQAPFGHVQLRAWSAPFLSYESAAAGGGCFGKGNIFMVDTAFGGDAPRVLRGLQGFAICPEPSTYALSLLGLAAVLLRARKKHPSRIPL